MLRHNLNQQQNKPLRYRLKLLGLNQLRLDPILLLALSVLFTMGILMLYSASNQMHGMVLHQITWLSFSLITMIICAQISPQRYFSWTVYLFSLAVLLLITVLIIGHISQGAQRWLSIGFIRFQPSELMLVTTPMMLAHYFSERQLPPSLSTTIGALAIVFVPFVLTSKQPDLGTGMLIAMTGFSVIILAGLNWKYLFGLLISLMAGLPILWHHMHEYQRRRILTFLYPQHDPLGSGYHIIQSKIAVGSGGLWGKGWLHGTQSHLQFLPAHTTDFIFSVVGEELGFAGVMVFIMVLCIILARCLTISYRANNTFTRLFSGGLSISFFFIFFINIAMVVGLVPVVGVPLPFVSYGGSSMLTLGATFGMIMSVHSHRQLLDN